MVKRPVGSSLVLKRSIVIRKHRTAISLEDPFWNAFREIAANKNVTISELVAKIDKQREHGNLSSAIRLFVLDHYRGMAGRERKEK